MDLKKYIIDRSIELNIDIIGFTDCQPLYRLKDYIALRQEDGRQTEFEEENIDNRIDPLSTSPKCKTIIVIGLSYHIESDERVDYRLKGKLSKSSWGLDYHYVLRKKIEKLIDEIKRKRDFNYRYFVDTGPLIERELAYRSGIGYYGKNCAIINERYGSFIFLGYMMTDLEIEFDSEYLENQCGDCNLCIEHCPTGALEEPFRFNPKRCISYLTQTKNRIPYESRKRMGNSIYGCDICQSVCPKNKNIVQSKHNEFLPDIIKGYMNIEGLLTMSNREFKEKYGHMAGSWRGKNILKRNGVITIGNMRDYKNLKLLESLLDDNSPMIREYAAWAILNTDYEYGYRAIEKRLDDEKGNTKLEMINLINYFNNSD